MTILLFNWRDIKNPKAGGAEIVTLEFARGWVKKGFQVIWFASSFPRSLSEEVVDGIEIVRRGNCVTVFMYALFYYFSCRKEIDVVVDEIHGLPFFTPLYVRKPLIAFIHEVAGEIWDFMYPFPINIIGKWLETFCLRFYRNVLFWTDAESTKKDLSVLGIPFSHCSVVNLPVTNEVVRVLGKKEKNATFLFVSRVVKMKGIEEVIKAFGFILKEDPDAVLWVVGGGDHGYIHKLQSMIENYGAKGHVTFWGKVDEKKKLSLMRRAHILLHASVKEGWGLVVIEAASQGTPAVVYNVSGLRDSVLDGKTGMVVRDNSPHCMAEQAMLLLRSKRKYETLQRNGMAWAKSLTWKKAIAESISIIEKAIDNKK